MNPETARWAVPQRNPRGSVATDDGERAQGEPVQKIVDEVSGEGLEKLLGERVTLFCLNYIYTGKLMGVNAMCVLLTDPSIVYETGAFSDPKWKDAQALQKDLYVMLACVEAFGLVK